MSGVKRGSIDTRRNRACIPFAIFTVKRRTLRRKGSSKVAFWSGLLAGIIIATLFYYLSDDDFLHSRFVAGWTAMEENTRHDGNAEMVFQHSAQSDGSNRRYHPHPVNETLVGVIAERVRVHCWVLTNPNSNESRARARAVHDTWAPRCNGYVFATPSPDDAELPALRLSVNESRDYLWGKTKAAFRHLYEHHLEEYDWFLKADDDTYVIVEDLRFLLMAHDPNESVFYGAKLHSFGNIDQGYMSGGAGYVLSRAALKAFVEKGLNNAKSGCNKGDEGEEDLSIGKCLALAGVKAGDSRDAAGKHRFLPNTVEFVLNPDKDKINWLQNVNNWFASSSVYPFTQGAGCCSDIAISFHYLSASQIYMLDYLVYHVHPYGADEFVAIDKDRSKLGAHLLASYRDAVAETGSDDPFKKNLTEIDTLPAHLAASRLDP